MRKLGLWGTLVCLSSPAFAQSLPKAGTIFTFDAIYAEADASGVMRTKIAFSETITIHDVRDNSVSFLQCADHVDYCTLGLTDFVSAQTVWINHGDDAPQYDLIEDVRATYFTQPAYAPQTFFPFGEGKTLNWTNDEFTEMTLTQTCCVADDAESWKLQRVAVIEDEIVQETVQHFDPAIGWYVFEQVDARSASLPDQRFRKILVSVGLP